MSMLALEVSMAAGPKLADDDNGCYRRMAKRYQEMILVSPWKRATIAVMVAAEEFGFDIAELRVRSRKEPLVTVRQKAMAFADFIGSGSTYEIGRALKRDHTTVGHAIRKYGEHVASAFGGAHELGK